MQKGRLFTLSCGVLWVLVVGVVVGFVSNHALTPGAAAASPDEWPALSHIQRAPDRATLVMFAHPKCPCTRASIGELALLMARCQDQVTGYVVFITPEGRAHEWAKTDLWDSAASIPGLRVLEDDCGVEAARFGAVTSGQTVLYDASGRLLFRGGITGARGHSGDNDGRSAVVSLLTSESVNLQQTPVFGCSLVDPPTHCREKETCQR